jgi:hypothetical protein
VETKKQESAGENMDILGRQTDSIRKKLNGDYWVAVANNL